jgi:hypothetical protein
MSRHYTAEEKQLVLQRLTANDYHIRRTSLETGIPERTLLTWRTKYLPPAPPPPAFRGAASRAIPPQLPPLPADEVLAFRDIKRQLMAHIHRLSHSIEEAIDEAPLSQRTTALSQLIDRVMKISSQLPPEPQDYRLEEEERQSPGG